MLRNSIRLALILLIAISPAFAIDCPADSSYHIDLRTMLPDGSPNPTYGQQIATGLCACLEFGQMLEVSDTTLILSVIMVDNEPVRGIELDLYHNVPGLLEYGGVIEKGSKLQNVTDDNGVPKTMTLLANQLVDYVKVMAYSTARAQTSGDGLEGELFRITYNILSGITSLPDSIAFSIGQCNIPGTSKEPSILNVVCSYPDTLNPVNINILLGTDLSSAAIPQEFQLGQNYPNPFNPFTRISYSVPVAGNIRINIYNVLGQRIRTLLNVEHIPGNYEIEWNGLDSDRKQVASGVYFYEMKSDQFVARKKMLFLR